MVAGFLAGYMEHASYGEAFRTAVAAGSASAFSEHLATRAEIEQILPLLLDSYPYSFGHVHPSHKSRRAVHRSDMTLLSLRVCLRRLWCKRPRPYSHNLDTVQKQECRHTFLLSD